MCALVPLTSQPTSLLHFAIKIKHNDIFITYTLVEWWLFQIRLVNSDTAPCACKFSIKTAGLSTHWGDVMNRKSMIMSCEWLLLHKRRTLQLKLIVWFEGMGIKRQWDGMGRDHKHWYHDVFWLAANDIFWAISHQFKFYFMTSAAAQWIKSIVSLKLGKRPLITRSDILK